MPCLATSWPDSSPGMTPIRMRASPPQRWRSRSRHWLAHLVSPGARCKMELAPFTATDPCMRGCAFAQNACAWAITASCTNVPAPLAVLAMARPWRKAAAVAAFAPNIGSMPSYWARPFAAQTAGDPTRALASSALHGNRPLMFAERSRGGVTAPERRTFTRCPAPLATRAREL